MQQTPPYGPPPQGGYLPPGYGAPLPQPPKRGMSGAMIALIVVGCLFGGCVMCGAIGAATKKDQPPVQATPAMTTASASPTEPRTAAPPTVTATDRPKAQALPVTAKQLFNDYQANEVSADDKYKGKTLLVSGSIASVDKDFTGSVILRLQTPNEFMSVGATLESTEKAKAGKLSKGEGVKLRCTGSGMAFGLPQLDDCTME